MIVSAPTFSRTRMTTTVTVKDGETIIIGGLIETSTSESETKVPFFGDIPYIGMFFRVDEDTQRSKELLIVITATVIRSEEDARRTEEQDVEVTVARPLLRPPALRCPSLPALLRRRYIIRGGPHQAGSFPACGLEP